MNKKQIKFDWPDIGQEKAQSFLEKSINSGKIAQTYIFLGLSDLGKNTMALAFARNLLLSDKNFKGDLKGVNSDLHILKKEEDKKLISIEQTRDFIRQLGLSSFLNSYKIAIIKEADLLSNEAKSALLKTLEEPKEKVIIILLLRDLNEMPETIISRAQVLRFYPVSSDFIYKKLMKKENISSSLAKSLANLSLGRPLKAEKLKDDPSVYEEEMKRARLFLDFFSLDLAFRRQSLEDYLKTDTKERDLAIELLNTWEVLWRDLILIKINRADLVLYFDLKADMQNLFSENDEDFFAHLLKLRYYFKAAHEQIEANVNPKNALLNLIYNI